ncbi:hypothetical protein P7C70_g9142, partial [Phenoliferia sp. Uapishka_3]
MQQFTLTIRHSDTALAPLVAKRQFATVVGFATEAEWTAIVDTCTQHSTPPPFHVTGPWHAFHLLTLDTPPLPNTLATAADNAGDDSGDELTTASWVANIRAEDPPDPDRSYLISGTPFDYSATEFPIVEIHHPDPLALEPRQYTLAVPQPHRLTSQWDKEMAEELLPQDREVAQHWQVPLAEAHATTFLGTKGISFPPSKRIEVDLREVNSSQPGWFATAIGTAHTFKQLSVKTNQATPSGHLDDAHARRTHALLNSLPPAKVRRAIYIVQKFSGDREPAFSTTPPGSDATLSPPGSPHPLVATSQPDHHHGWEGDHADFPPLSSNWDDPDSDPDLSEPSEAAEESADEESATDKESAAEESSDDHTTTPTPASRLLSGQHSSDFFTQPQPGLCPLPPAGQRAATDSPVAGSDARAESDSEDSATDGPRTFADAADSINGTTSPHGVPDTLADLFFASASHSPTHAAGFIRPEREFSPAQFMHAGLIDAAAMQEDADAMCGQGHASPSHTERIIPRFREWHNPKTGKLTQTAIDTANLLTDSDSSGSRTVPDDASPSLGKRKI